MDDEIQPDRLDAIVDGQPVEGGSESEFADLVSALRADRSSAPPGLRQRVIATAERPRRRIPAFLRWPTVGAGLVPVLAAAALVVGFLPTSTTKTAPAASFTTSAAEPGAYSAASPAAATKAPPTTAQGRLGEADESTRATTPETTTGGATRPLNSAKTSTPKPTATTATKRQRNSDKDGIPTGRLVIASGLGLTALGLLGAVVVPWVRRRRTPEAFPDA